MQQLYERLPEYVINGGGFLPFELHTECNPVVVVGSQRIRNAQALPG